jgi:hypothetical protein
MLRCRALRSTSRKIMPKWSPPTITCRRKLILFKLWFRRTLPQFLRLKNLSSAKRLSSNKTTSAKFKICSFPSELSKKKLKKIRNKMRQKSSLLSNKKPKKKSEPYRPMRSDSLKSSTKSWLIKTRFWLWLGRGLRLRKIRLLNSKHT